MQTSGKSAEKLGLGDVPDRVGTQVRPNSNVETDDRADTGELPHAYVWDKTTLHAHDLRRRQTHPGPDEPK